MSFRGPQVLLERKQRQKCFPITLAHISSLPPGTKRLVLRLALRGHTPGQRPPSDPLVRWDQYFRTARAKFAPQRMSRSMLTSIRPDAVRYSYCRVLKALQRLLANSPKESGFLWLMNGVIPMSYSGLANFPPKCRDRTGPLRLSPRAFWRTGLSLCA